MFLKEKLELLKVDLQIEETKLYPKDKLSDYYKGKKDGISLALNLIDNINISGEYSNKINKCKICNISQPEHRIKENNICITCERDKLLENLKIEKSKRRKYAMNNNSTRIYEIEFMEYTNTMKDTVMVHSDKIIYKSLPPNHEGKILIAEEDIPKWQNYGNGIKSMRYVGEFHKTE
jgi:hypothetical protein